jgi:hypothetical protein
MQLLLLYDYSKVAEHKTTILTFQELSTSGNKLASLLPKSHREQSVRTCKSMQITCLRIADFRLAPTLNTAI